MRGQRLADEVHKQVRDQIRRDGVGADHDQGKRPPSAPGHVDPRVKTREQQAAPPAAEQHPTRRPNALHHRTHSEPAQQRARRQPAHARDHEPPDLFPRRPFTAEHVAREQPENHRRQRRHETQRRVAAAVKKKRFLARKKIEPPRLKARREVRVLLPMRRKPREPVRLQPALRHAHLRVVETGRRQRVECKGRPHAHHDQHERRPLLAHRTEPEREKKTIAQTDLRERVLKRPVRQRPPGRPQKHPEQNQDRCAPDRVPDHRAGRLPPGPPARDRIRQRHADQKRERRLDEIVQRAPDPFDVRLLRREKTPDPAVGQRLRHALQPQYLRHHEQHHETAVGIERSEAGGRTDRRNTDRGRRRRGGHAPQLSRVPGPDAKANRDPTEGRFSQRPPRRVRPSSRRLKTRRSRRDRARRPRHTCNPRRAAHVPAPVL